MAIKAVEAATDPVDVLCMDVPLFMRLMELSRETLDTDVMIHEVVTNVVRASKTTPVMTIEDYGLIWPDRNSGGFEPEDSPDSEYASTETAADEKKFNVFLKHGTRQREQNLGEKNLLALEYLPKEYKDKALKLKVGEIMQYVDKQEGEPITFRVYITRKK